ncbi:anthrone oxygenase family protein [Pseudonocardia sp. DLS-67]
MQRRPHVDLRTAAELGLAHWFFGNLYEEVVRMPARIADQPPTGGAFAPGSPVRYYVPAAPVTLATTLACVATGWHRRADRPALTAAALLTATGAVLTGHLVRSVNLPLLDAARRPADPAERRRLVGHWHRVNRVRLVAVAAAVVALRAGRRG